MKTTTTQTTHKVMYKAGNEQFDLMEELGLAPINVISNMSMTDEEVLNFAGWSYEELEEVACEHGWDGIDIEDITIEML